MFKRKMLLQIKGDHTTYSDLKCLLKKYIYSESKSPNVDSLMEKAFLSTNLSNFFCHISPNIMS